MNAVPYVRLVTLLALVGGQRLCAGELAVHASGRYYQNAAGKVLFLLGYYDWCAVPDGYYIDHPSRYRQIMRLGRRYGLNYLRISLGVNRMAAGGHPPSWNGVPTPVPFAYVKNHGQWSADLDQWDSVFWEGLKAQCAYAKRAGFIVHVSIFDGVELRRQGGADYGYANSFWNPRRQVRTFYPDPDANHNGQIDDAGEFYHAAEFNGALASGTLSYYQKRLIDKTVTELAGCDNVFFEIGNELLGSSASWNSSVLSYLKTKTSKAVTQCNNYSDSNRGTGLQGWSQHNANTPAEVKANLASIIGRGWPAWEDPDGPALSNADVSPGDLRRAAWYAFVGGAACWGGFTRDFWRDVGRGFNKPTAIYYRNVQRFIRETRVAFWNMAPQNALVSNPAENACLAQDGASYLAYILHDVKAILNLGGLTGSGHYRLYDPRNGRWSQEQTVAGGARRTFLRPHGADDWVIYIQASPDQAPR